MISVVSFVKPMDTCRHLSVWITRASWRPVRMWANKDVVYVLRPRVDDGSVVLPTMWWALRGSNPREEG